MPPRRAVTSSSHTAQRKRQQKRLRPHSSSAKRHVKAMSEESEGGWDKSESGGEERRDSVRLGEVGSEDEDIDSDEAGEESMSEDAASKSNAKEHGPKTKDPESEANDERMGEFLDVADMLDLNMYPDTSNSDSDSAEEVESEFSAPSEDEELGLPKLQSFIDRLPNPTKRSADGDLEEVDSRKKKRRRILEEKGEAWDEAEGEWIAVGLQSNKLTLDDMLSTLPESQNSKSLRNSLKSLSASKKHPSTSTSLRPNPFTAPGPLSVPLPASHQNKHERAAAFELTSREVTKWDAISKVMRGHGEVKGLSNRVVLPLPASDGQNKEGKTAGDLASKFVPKRGGMEDEISALLQSGEMSSSQLVAREGKGKEREEKEDQAARVGALRLERDLLFRAERKAKRVAKIKSKAFRKIKRKALAASKEGEGDLETLQQLDALDGGTRAAEELEKLERLRAKERVTLRHGGGGKWATKVGGLELEGLERDERDAAVREKEELARKLRQRIAGPDSESDEEDDGKGDGSDEAELERYAAELERLKAEENGGKLKGPYAMKFMIQAQARKEQERERELERVRKELNGEQSEDERLEEEYLFREKVDGNLGRLLFGKQADLTPKEGLIKTPPEEARQLVSDSPPPRIDILPDVPSFQARSVEGNPWLSAFNKEQPLLKPKKVHANGPQDKIEKRKGKTASALLKDATDATVEIDVKSFVEPAARASKREKGSKSAKADGAAHSINKGRKEESESEEDGEQVKFTQRELVAEAFEGDDVVAAFEAEKRMEVERDAPRTEDVTLPGWGSWTGKGVKKQKTDKKYIKNIPGIDRNERTDAKLGHVIISEKKDKRATRYLVKDLPWPYTSEAQFRKTMARNIGKEWNTAQSLRDMTRDGGEGGVTVKRGATVRPLEATI